MSNFFIKRWKEFKVDYLYHKEYHKKVPWVDFNEFLLRKAFYIIAVIHIIASISFTLLMIFE